MNAYRIKKYIGAYTTVMNGLDAIVFTAGIGENSDIIRSLVCKEMDYMGISINEKENKIRSKKIRDISNENSRVQRFLSFLPMRNWKLQNKPIHY
jgi:acetate kinase